MRPPAASLARCCEGKKDGAGLNFLMGQNLPLGPQNCQHAERTSSILVESGEM